MATQRQRATRTETKPGRATRKVRQLSVAPSEPPVATPSIEAATERYVDHSLNLLLDKFGAGGATPGSGSATAVFGAIAAQLVQTVAQLTLRRDDYGGFHERSTRILAETRAISRRLRAAIDSDSVLFERVMNTRAARDSEQNAMLRDRLVAQELLAMRDATVLPLQIASDCTATAELALEMAESGYRSARGDSVSAMYSAIAATRGAIAIAARNLHDMRRAVVKLGSGEEDFVWLRKEFALAGGLLARLSEVERRAGAYWVGMWSGVAAALANSETPAAVRR